MGSSPQGVDWNNDGKKDLILGERNGYIRVYLNTGTAATPAFSGYNNVTVGGSTFCYLTAMPEVVDWNNDGKKDIICGEDAGRTLLLLNTGTDAAPAFSSTTILTPTVSYRSSPVAVDFNQDGKKDLIIGDGSGFLWYFENIGTDASPAFNGSIQLTAGGTPINVGYCARLEAVDWNNDGLPDILAGGSDGRVKLFLARQAISFLGHTASDENGNGLIERNETVSLVSVVQSTSLATNAVATLTCTSSWCAVQQGSWEIGALAAGGTATNSSEPFEVLIAGDAPLGARIPLRLVVSANGGALADTNTVFIDVAQPALSLADVFINDTCNGNGNCALDAGERVHLVFRLTNSGIRADYVAATLSSTSPYLTCSWSNTVLGCVEAAASVKNSALPFAFDVSAGCPSNAVHAMQIEVRCPGVNTNRLQFSIRGSSDYLVNRSASYAWIDTSGGTRIYPGDEGWMTLTLPFAFPLYGARTNRLTINANGAITMNDQVATYMISTIPSTDVPNGLIAPFWDDLDSTSSGAVRYQQFGSAPNRYFVVEWNRVPFFSYSGEVTVQAILHENGTIKFQYGNVTGNGDGRTASIGIESATGDRGCQVSYCTAGSVTNGMATAFTPLTAADANTNGLPDAFETFYFGGLGAAPGADSDGDGLSNLAEFKAGTDPVDSGVCLRFEEARRLPGQVSIEWQSIPGRSYSVLEATLYSTVIWTNATPVPVIGSPTGINEYTTTINPARPSAVFKIRTP